MSNFYFPYGNDLKEPWGWLGFPDTKSRYWMATYIGGWPISAFVNGHTIAIFGTESLTAGIATLYSFGIQGSVGPGKLFKSGRQVVGRKWDGPIERKRVDDLIDKQEKNLDAQRKVEQVTRISEFNSAIDIFNTCLNYGTKLECETPMSLNDFDYAAGGIFGAEIELIGAASAYYISADSDGKTLLENQQVYNMGGGLIGIGGGAASGFWVLRKQFSARSLSDPDNDMPLEVSSRDAREIWLDRLGMRSVSLSEKPYYRYFDCPDYIRELPSIYSEVPDYVVELGKDYAEREETWR